MKIIKWIKERFVYLTWRDPADEVLSLILDQVVINGDRLKEIEKTLNFSASGQPVHGALREDTLGLGADTKEGL